MKNIIVFIFSLILVITFAVAACNSDKSSSATNKEIEPARMTKDSLVKRGEYLVTIMGCNDCHSPKKMGPNGPEPDQERLLSGHPSNMPLGKINPKELESWVLFHPNQTATAGPWGVSFAANITSDETGIGNWTEMQFFTAMRKGKYKGIESGRQLLPPMPWPNFSKATDEDLRAIFYYLKSTKPIKNVVPNAVGPAMGASPKR